MLADIQPCRRVVNSHALQIVIFHRHIFILNRYARHSGRNILAVNTNLLQLEIPRIICGEGGKSNGS